MTAQPSPPSAPLQARDRVLILDFGSQFTQLIARRVRESGVYCEIMPYTAGPERMLDFGASAYILSGGPASVKDAEAPRVPDLVFQSGLPVLGICYGQQAMCDQLGGEVSLGDHQEFGHATLTVSDDCALFHGAWEIGGREQVWMSHGDHVTKLPPGFRTVASSAGAPFAAIADDSRRYYGVQFHPEVVHTPHGRQLLHNFTHGVAGLTGDWSMAGVPGGAEAADPGAGGGWAGDLRPVGRGGQRGCGGVDPGGGGRAVDVHLRRYGTAAAEPRRRRWCRRFGTGSRRSWCIGTRAPCSCGSWRG